uniref:Integrase catalytic domain-containing protein n=1 Tax=Micrurus surinamensis TaxID=129470 RepID=A0A2D4P0L8_MICSU
MPTTTTERVAITLKRIFATHGLPDTIVSDNGPQFTSGEFEVFLASLEICHILTAPFHPASNGLVERAVRSAKEALERFDLNNWHDAFSRYLMAQHTTPCTSTNKSPAELLMGRKLRTTLDRLHPSYTPAVPLDSSSLSRKFIRGSKVYVRNYAGMPLWLPGSVEEVTGPRSYRVHFG